MNSHRGRATGPRHRSSSFCHDNRHLPDRPDHRPAHQGRRTPSYGVVDTAGALQRCLDTLLAAPRRPDAVVATGDLVDFGSEEEYRFLHGLLAALPMPVYLLPGNHDSRAMLRRCSPTTPTCSPAAPATSRCTTPGRRSAAPGGLRLHRAGPRRRPRRGGRLRWLDATLAAAPATPTLLMLHHPPFHTGIGHMDTQGLEGAADLEAVVCRHPRWSACCAATCYIVRRFGGTLAMTAPGPAHQVALDLDPRPRAPHGAAGLPAALVACPARPGHHAAASGDHGPIPSTMRMAG